MNGSDVSKADSVSAEPLQTTRVDAAHRQRLDVLFREIDKKLVATLRCRLRSVDDAREVAQETYERLLRVRDPEILDWKSYAYTVAMNLATNVLTQRSRRRAIDEMLPVATEDRRSPELICEVRSDFEMVMQTVDELPPRSRAAVASLVDGEDPAVLAKRLNVDRRTARRHLIRAVEYLQAAFEFCKRGGRG